jgi:hypothetical protein
MYRIFPCKNLEVQNYLIFMNLCADFGLLEVHGDQMFLYPQKAEI